MTLPPELEQQAREIAASWKHLTFREERIMREAMLVALEVGRRQGLEEAAKVYDQRLSERVRDTTDPLI